MELKSTTWPFCLFKTPKTCPPQTFSTTNCRTVFRVMRSPDSHLGLDDVGVNLSHSVDGVRAHDAQMSHVDPLTPVLLDQRHFPQLFKVFGKHNCDFLQRHKENAEKATVSQTC